MVKEKRKILLNDGMDKEGIELLNSEGIEADTKNRDAKELADCIGEFDALVVRSKTEVTREIIHNGAKGKLKFIGRAGVGSDNIEKDYAAEKGIIVSNAPNGITNSTAEMAMALIFATSRKIPQAHYSLTEGVWKKKQFGGVEISRKTLGIIGCGRIGQRLSELVRGLDMEVIGYDISSEDVRKKFPESRIKYLSLEEVLKNSDYISLHTGGKERIIGKNEIDLMKPNSIFINLSRGKNVDQKSLYDALVERRIGGAGLDVHEGEPKKESSPFESWFEGLDNVVLTPHLGGSTKEGQIKTSIEMAGVVIDYLVNGHRRNVVNLKDSTENVSEKKNIYPVQFSHKDQPGVFASIDKIFADSGINILESETGNNGKGNAITTYKLSVEIEQEILDKLKHLPNVYRVVI